MINNKTIFFGIQPNPIDGGFQVHLTDSVSWLEFGSATNPENSPELTERLDNLGLVSLDGTTGEYGVDEGVYEDVNELRQALLDSGFDLNDEYTDYVLPYMDEEVGDPESEDVDDPYTRY